MTKELPTRDKLHDMVLWLTSQALRANDRNVSAAEREEAVQAAFAARRAVLNTIDALHAAAIEGRNDSERLDFLQAQHFTKWVGRDVDGGTETWPVFPGTDLRIEIDRARGVAGEVPATGANSGNSHD